MTRGTAKARTVWILLAVVAGLTLALPPALRSFGHWLVVQDALAAADAIFVHGGPVPFRAIEAAEIYLQGHAPEVWLAVVRPTPEEEALERLGIEKPEGWTYSRQVLERLGVPADAIRLLERKVLNTADEVEAVAEELQRRGGRRVILVTSKQHSRRVRIIWDRTTDGSLEAVVRHAESDPFDPDRWWRNTEDGQNVVHEIFGILNAWAGSPLRPERSAPAPVRHPVGDEKGEAPRSPHPRQAVKRQSEASHP